MKIIKISEEKTFFNLEERRNKMGEEDYKKSLVAYYNKYAHQSYEIDNKILKLLERFKDDDFLMSILYEDLYNRNRKENKEIIIMINEIKLEKDRSKKIHRLLQLYSLTHENPSAYEMDSLIRDMGQMNNGQINNYIDKYVVNWGKIK